MSGHASEAKLETVETAAKDAAKEGGAKKEEAKKLETVENAAKDAAKEGDAKKEEPEEDGGAKDAAKGGDKKESDEEAKSLAKLEEGDCAKDVAQASEAKKEDGEEQRPNPDGQKDKSGEGGKDVDAKLGASAAVAGAHGTDADETKSTTSTVRKSGSAVDALRKYIAGFTDSTKKGQTGKLQLGSQAPCRSYRSLLVLTEFNELEARLHSCRSKDDIANAHQFYKTFKAAYMELMSMGRAAASRLTAAVDRQQEVKKGLQKVSAASSKAKKVVGNNVQKQSVLLDAFGSFGEEVESIVYTAGTLVTDLAKLATPLIIRVDCQSEEFGPDSMVASFCIVFGNRFLKSEERADPGRAQKKIPDGSEKAVQALFLSMYPEKHHINIPTGADDPLRAHLIPILFAINKGRETCAPEPGYLGTTRLLMRGTRRCILLRIEAIWEYLEKVLKCTPVTLKKVRQWAQGANAHNFQAFRTAFKEQNVLKF